MKFNETKEKRIKYREFWPKLFNILKPSRKIMKGILIVTIFLEGTALIGPYILKVIIDKLIAFDPSEITNIVILAIFMLALD